MPVKVTWDDSILSGVKRIDNQHRDYVKALNRLIEADEGLRGSKTGEEVSDAISFLDGFVVFHFATEERYMIMHKYPGLKHHISQHKTFINNVETIKTHYANEGPSPRLRKVLKENLLRWYLVHMKDVDGQMGRFLRERGCV